MSSHVYTSMNSAVPLGSLSLFQNLGAVSRQEAGGITGSLCFHLPGITILYHLISSVLRAIVLYILPRCFCCFRLGGNSIPCYSFFLESEIYLPIFALDLSFISKSLTYSSQWQYTSHCVYEDRCMLNLYRITSVLRLINVLYFS